MNFQGLWNRKHDEIIVAILGGLAVIFIGWLCKKVFPRFNGAQKSDHGTSSSTVVTASPQITQQFSPTINNNIHIPALVEPISNKSTDRRCETDRRTLEELQRLLPEQDGIARLRHQRFWLKFNWTLDAVLLPYLEATSGPNHRFLDPELEDLRSQLYSAIKDLGDRIHRYSDPLSNSPTERYFWKLEQESVTEWDARRDEVWKLAERVCKLYDELILTGRRNLHE
jgi:hypothetical protein